MSNRDYNAHLSRALHEVEAKSSTDKDLEETETGFICVANEDITFTIQSGPVKENGRNGCDATDIIRYAIGLYRSFNSANACKENSCTITKLQEALHWQEARTKRGVEGTDTD